MLFWGTNTGHLLHRCISSLLYHRFACPKALPSFAPVALSAGRRGNGRRSPCGCPLLSAFPQKNYSSYRVPSVWGNRSKQWAFVCSTAAVQKRKRQQSGGLIVMASALLCHALRQQAFVLVGGEAVGGEKMQRYGGRSKTS